jgi:hypothetical protein
MQTTTGHSSAAANALQSLLAQRLLELPAPSAVGDIPDPRKLGRDPSIRACEMATTPEDLAAIASVICAHAEAIDGQFRHEAAWTYLAACLNGLHLRQQDVLIAAIARAPKFLSDVRHFTSPARVIRAAAVHLPDPKTTSKAMALAKKLAEDQVAGAPSANRGSEVGIRDTVRPKR